MVQIRLQTLVRERGSSVALNIVRSYGASCAAPLFLGWMMYNNSPAPQATSWIPVEQMLKEPRGTAGKPRVISRSFAGTFLKYLFKIKIGTRMYTLLTAPSTTRNDHVGVPDHGFPGPEEPKNTEFLFPATQTASTFDEASGVVPSERLDATSARFSTSSNFPKHTRVVLAQRCDFTHVGLRSAVPQFITQPTLLLSRLL